MNKHPDPDVRARWSLFFAVAIAVTLGLFTIECGCNTSTPKITGPVEGGVEIESKQTENNPWPWMIAAIVGPVAMVLLFLTYLYMSKSYTGMGRT